jgi:hypothetical protein
VVNQNRALAIQGGCDSGILEGHCRGSFLGVRPNGAATKSRA